MASPINPPRITVEEADDLPAYVSTGLIGLRVLTRPLTPGTTIVSGLSGRHPVAQVEAAARAPYPLAGDIQLNGAWMSDMPGQVAFRSQSYAFSCGELTTEFDYRVDGVTARVEVLTFCSRREPTIVAQQVTIRTTSRPRGRAARSCSRPAGTRSRSSGCGSGASRPRWRHDTRQRAPAWRRAARQPAARGRRR